MSDETWEIEVGDRIFTVPRLPFKYSRKVYPICQRLSNADLEMRVKRPTEPLQITEDEARDLGEILLLACQAADPTLTKDEFEEMPITPPQMYDGFFAIRKACGGWVTLTEGQKLPGEELGTAEPPM